MLVIEYSKWKFLFVVNSVDSVIGNDESVIKEFRYINFLELF